MAVERPAGYDPIASDPMSATPAVEEQIEVSEEMIENPDGSVTFGEEEVAEEQVPFGANLAEILDDDILQNISSDLQQQFEDDKASRDDWYHSYTQGLDLLGFKYQERTQPFQGASSVTHPLLAEAVTSFQAQAYKELLPSGGPVKCNVVGKMDVQVEEQSQRVKEYMNYLIMDEMEEYDADTDQLLFYLPLAGSAFKKIYYDAALGRPVSKFIPSEDLIVPYLATDLNSAERVTHVIKMTPNEVRKGQVAGLYRDVELHDPEVTQNRVQEKYNQLEGVSRVSYDELYEILEIHCDLDIEGFEDKDEELGEETGIKIPYVVTIDESSGKILSVYRNYRENDPLKKKIPYFVHYKFLPGLGFYGFGLIHMLGGLSRAATSALRQLIDAGTLSNLPAGFKARGIRIADDDTPLQPGEFRDIDAPSGDLRQGLMPLPYKGPDQTLFALLGYVVDAGKRFAAVADQKMGEGSQANPVGTTMAIIEQGSKIMSAIHKRLHYAQKKEFKILARIITDYLPPEYPYQVVGGNQMIKQTDFDGRVDIIPISDPNIFSMSQRITLAQTQLQLAQANPQIHNQYEAYRRMYQAMGVQNIEALLPPPQKPMPTDAAMENSSMLLQKPAMAFPQQDHVAHIDTHRAFMSTYLVKNSPPVLSLIQSHISNHVSELAKEDIMMRNQTEIQQLTEQYGGQIPPELQQQFEIETAKQVAVKIKELTETMVAEEQEYLEGMQKDPLVTLKQEELGLRAEELELRAQKDGEKQALEEEKVEIDARQEQEKIDNANRHATNREQIQLKKINEPSKLRNKY